MEIQTIRSIPVAAFSSSLILSGIFCVAIPRLDAGMNFFLMAGMLMIPWTLFYIYKADEILSKK